MNKKLLALAVAGACIAPTAMAQTANPVTLYGRVYVTFESVEAKGGVPSRTRIEDQASLLGVRGTEDLGGGLKAFFQLETAFKPDAAVSPPAFANRNSGVGLQGGFGSIIIGRWDMPWKLATIAIDPFGDLTIGGITGTLSDLGNFDRRDNNVFQYWSPNMGGLALRVAGQADETPNVRNWGASLTFTRGPVYVFGAWEKHELAAGEEEGFALGGSLSFGPVKVGAQYQKMEKTGSPDQDGVMLNAVFTAGKNQFILQYMKAEDHNFRAGAECDSYNGGYQYNFTRRTFFLAQYTHVKNNASAVCNFGANRLTIAAGQDPRGFSLGLRHVF